MNRGVVFMFILVLSVMACSIQTSPTVPTTFSPTVVKSIDIVTTVITTPVTTPEWTTTVSQVLVNVHVEPDGEVIGAVKIGDSLIVLSCDVKWCKVAKPAGARWKRDYGYIFRGCLSDNPKKLGCEAK